MLKTLEPLAHLTMQDLLIIESTNNILIVTAAQITVSVYIY